MIKDKFSTKEAAKLSGLSVHMVHYLVNQEILQPSTPRLPGRGKRRQYSFGEIILLRAIQGLLFRGVSVKRLKTAIKARNKIFREMSEDNCSAKYFLTDGKSVFEPVHRKEDYSDQVLVDLTAGGQMAFGFVLDIQKIHADLCNDVRELNRARSEPNATKSFSQ